MEPLPEPEDLIWLFEGEPDYPYAEDERRAGYELGWREPWPYTRVIFRLSRDGRSVLLDLEPGYEQVRLQIRDAESEVVDLLLRQVSGMAIDRSKGQELLRLDFAESFNGRSLWLRLKPEISLGWEVGSFV